MVFKRRERERDTYTETETQTQRETERSINLTTLTDVCFMLHYCEEHKNGMRKRIN